MSETTGNTGDRPLLGVTLLLACLLLMAAMSALVKLLGEGYPVQQILLFRFGFAALTFAFLVPGSGGMATLKTDRPIDHAIRTGSGIIALSTFFFAITAIPIADATAISYAAPVFIVVLSIVFLGERIGIQRWLAVIVGFVGMILIAKPGVVTLDIGYIAAIVSAVTSAMVAVWLRRLAPTEKTVTIGLYYNVTGTVVIGLWVVSTGWITPDPVDLALMVLLGVIAGPQQYLFAASYRFAEASLLAPIDYAILIFAAAIGYLFWGEVPSLTTWIGCAIITGSGIFVAYRERVVGRKPRARKRLTRERV